MSILDAIYVGALIGVGVVTMILVIAAAAALCAGVLWAWDRSDQWVWNARRRWAARRGRGR